VSAKTAIRVVDSMRSGSTASSSRCDDPEAAAAAIRQ
jgi:hypothetical protein